MKFFEHPLSVHAVLFGMVQDVNLPESQQELSNDRIAFSLHPSPLRRGLFARTKFRPWPDLVRPSSSNLVAGAQIAKDFHQRTGGETGLDIHPFRLAVADPDHERAVGRRGDAAARDEQR